MADILTPQQAQKTFNISPASLKRAEDDGKLSSLRTPGGHRRYRADDIEALISPVAKAADPAIPANPRRPETYAELGTTGLSRWGGSVYTETLKELRGQQGRVLYHEMRASDPVISAVFFALIHSLKKAQPRIAPASEAKPDILAAELVESCLTDMSLTWADTFTHICEPTFEQGFSVLEIVYKRRLGEKPALYCDNPAASQFNDGKVGWRKWAPRPAESLASGDEWIFDDHGGIRGINQADPNSGVSCTIPMEKLLHFRTTVYPANTPEPPPIHRPAYMPWWYTTNLQEIEGIGIERNLNGIPVLYLGNDCTMGGAESDYEKGQNLVTNIRQDEQAGVVIPKAKMGSGATEGNGMLLELLSAGASQTIDIGPVIERYDKRKAIIILAQFIMLGMDQVGSYALSRSQNDMFILAATSWLNSFADIINRHAIPRLMNLNAFPGLTGMPTIVFDPLGVPDLVGMADFVNKLVDKEVLTPDEELERHLRQMAGLPQKIEEVTPAPSGGETGTTDGKPATGGEGAPENLDSVKGLNGAQINAALDILAQISSNSISPTVGVELLVSLGLERARAELIIREAQKGPVMTRPGDTPKQPQARVIAAPQLEKVL